MAKELTEEPQVPISFRQLGIFLLDGSLSMTEPGDGGLAKHQQVNMAVRETLTRFKASRVIRGFSFAVVAFGMDARIHTPITALTEIDDNESYDPIEPPLVDGSGTFIGAGLAKCEELADEFLNNPVEGIPNKVAILVLSDGMSESNATLKIAEKIKSKSNIELYCCHFLGLEKDENQDKAQKLLQQVASNPVMGYKTVPNSATIRDFFIASISVSAGMGRNG